MVDFNKIDKKIPYPILDLRSASESEQKLMIIVSFILFVVTFFIGFTYEGISNNYASLYSSLFFLVLIFVLFFLIMKAN